jgi:glycosyltransferase involved in cell wall biosynthesis
LHIVGEGSERAALQQLANQLQIAEKVTFGPRLNSEAMPQYYRALDILVLPSRTQANWKEQFGRVLTEAMACGVAVIGSDSGEIPHVIGAAGRIFPEGDATALRHYLQQLLDQPAERIRLSQLGRQRVLDCYTMASVAQQTVVVYEKLMAKKLEE